MARTRPTLTPETAPESVSGWLRELAALVGDDLDHRLANPDDLVEDAPTRRLHDAIRYAALGPGKRLRPAMCLAACEALGGGRERALPAAAAVELVHAYTLVHDDLPAMDDDDTRRGRPTVHRAYDEATAILAGDALLTRAFATLAELGPRTADAVRVLGARAGDRELLAGQARDLAGDPDDVGGLDAIHRAKTGALFSASAELGAICAGADVEARRVLAQYGMSFGVAFQHADDRDDGDHAELRERAGDRLERLAAEAESLARSLGAGAEPLVALAAWVRSVGA